MNNTIAEYFSLADEQLPEVRDLRGLEAPEPIEIILLECSRLPPDGRFLAHLPHIPHPLFPLLETRGLQWQVHEKPDGSALVLIGRDA